SEVAAESNTHTIALDWQVLLMEAMRKVDEAGAGRRGKKLKSDAKRKVLVLDDSLMLLSFVKDILGEANYQVTTAPTATQGLAAAKADPPDLILLDYILPDMKGDEVARRVRNDLAISNVPIVYMSAVGVDLQMDRSASPNVIGFLNKPFTSDLLIKTVENHIPKSPDESPPETDEQSTQQASEAAGAESVPALEPKDNLSAGESGSAKADEWWSSPQPQPSWPEPATPSTTTPDHMTEADFVPTDVSSAVHDANLPNESVTGGAYFCGDTRFFSLNWALQTIAKEKLTGALRSFWAKEPVDLLARDGQVVLVTTHDPELYCSEAPITLVNVDAGKIDDARAQQRETGRPIFVTLAESGDILNEPATQLIQHYGQKLFAQLWTAERVRFTFEQKPELPAYAANMTADGDLDHWELATLRLIQSQDVGNKANYDPSSIPAYTRDGFNRVQDLRLTVAEAQFASQFNGARSIAQIAKNLRLDLKFARLTLFRFLALEIVECWPPTTALKPERKGVLQRITRSIGIGE
ncbi:MAG: domain S-box, partial [Spartobacteria bacterium]|nr:domain S-box [Spartobacteria bacterium]